MFKVYVDAADLQGGHLQLTLDGLARKGAWRMPAAALEAEVADHTERHRGERDARGHALVARNGRARRRRVTKGAGSRMKGLTMAYELLDMAEKRWRRLAGSELLPLVRVGVRFTDGLMQERDDHEARKEAARPSPIHNI